MRNDEKNIEQLSCVGLAVRHPGCGAWHALSSPRLANISAGFQNCHAINGIICMLASYWDLLGFCPLSRNVYRQNHDSPTMNYRPNTTSIESIIQYSHVFSPSTVVRSLCRVISIHISIRSAILSQPCTQ